MTPAIKCAKKARIHYEIHEYSHDPKTASYAFEAAEKLHIAPERIFKTLVVSLDNGTMAVGIVSASSQLSLKNMAKALGTKKVVMAEKNRVERATGYVLGGVSPLGQKRKLSTVIDVSAMAYETIFVSAGKRGLEIELAAKDLQNLTQGVFAAIAKL